MVQAVSDLLARDSEPTREEETPFFIEEIARAVSMTSSSDRQQDELRTAFTDLFQDPIGPSFDWLVSLCSAFVAICSLVSRAGSKFTHVRLGPSRRHRGSPEPTWSIERVLHCAHCGP
jgi:hypothetical protein